MVLLDKQKYAQKEDGVSFPIESFESPPARASPASPPTAAQQLWYEQSSPPLFFVSTTPACHDRNYHHSAKTRRGELKEINSSLMMSNIITTPVPTMNTIYSCASSDWSHDSNRYSTRSSSGDTPTSISNNMISFSPSSASTVISSGLRRDSRMISPNSLLIPDLDGSEDDYSNGDYYDADHDDRHIQYHHNHSNTENMINTCNTPKSFSWKQCRPDCTSSPSGSPHLLCHHQNKQDDSHHHRSRPRPPPQLSLKPRKKFNYAKRRRRRISSSYNGSTSSFSPITTRRTSLSFSGGVENNKDENTTSTNVMMDSHHPRSTVFLLQKKMYEDEDSNDNNDDK